MRSEGGPIEGFVHLDMSDSGSEGNDNPITGFLFGNIDQNNKLDVDYLNAVSLHWVARAYSVHNL